MPENRANKRSVSPIRFPEHIEKTSEITTTIIYQKTTSIECSRKSQASAGSNNVPPGGSGDPRVRSIENDAGPSKSSALVKSREKSSSERERLHQHFKEVFNDRELQRRAGSRNNSAERYGHHNESDRRHKQHHRPRSREQSSKDGYHGRQHETHSRYEHRSSRTTERHVGSHRTGKRSGSSFARDLERQNTPNQSSSDLVPFKTKDHGSSLRGHRRDHDSHVQSRHARHGDSFSISSEDSNDTIETSVRIETHTTQLTSTFSHRPKNEQSTEKWAPDKDPSLEPISSDTDSSRHGRPAIHAIRQTSFNHRESEQSERTETLKSEGIRRERSQPVELHPRIFNDYKTFDQKNVNLGAKEKCTNPQPSASESATRSFPPRPKSCFQSKLEVQTTKPSQSAHPRPQELSTPNFNRKDPRLHSDYCKKREEDTQRHQRADETKPNEIVAQRNANKKRRMSCYQPEESTRVKSRRLSVHESSKQIEAKESFSYRIPKFPKTNEDLKATTSGSTEDKDVLTKIKSFAEKDLPKEETPENLVSKLKEVLGSEDFLKIRSLLVEKPSSEKTDSKAEEIKMEATQPSSPRLSVDVKRMSRKELSEKLSDNISAKKSAETITEKKAGRQATNDETSPMKQTSKPKEKAEISSAIKRSKILDKREDKVATVQHIEKSYAAKSSSKNSNGRERSNEKATERPTTRKRVSTVLPKIQECKKVEEIKKKKLNELDRLHLDIKEIYGCEGFLSGYKPRSCRNDTHEPVLKKTGPDHSLNDKMYLKQYNLKTFSIPLMKLNLSGNLGPFQLNRSFLLKNPDLKSELEDIVNKQEDEEAEDEMCDDGHVSIASSNDSFEEIIAEMAKPEPKKIAPILASPARKKSKGEAAEGPSLKQVSTVPSTTQEITKVEEFKRSPKSGALRRKQRNWSKGIISKKARKKKKTAPKDSEDEWEEVEKEAAVEKTKMKLGELIKLMNMFEKKIAKESPKKSESATTDFSKEKETPRAISTAKPPEESQENPVEVSQSMNLLVEPKEPEVQAPNNRIDVSTQENSTTEQPTRKSTKFGRYSDARVLDLEKRLETINKNLQSIDFKATRPQEAPKKKTVCVVRKANQNISFNAEKKLKCELCLYVSTDTAGFLNHLQRKHALNVWSQYCNICKSLIKDSNHSLASELGHLLTHMTYSVSQKSTSQAKPFLKVRQLPGDKLSTLSLPSTAPLAVATPLSSHTVAIPPRTSSSSSSLALVTVKALSSTPDSSNRFTQLFQVKIPSATKAVPVTSSTKDSSNDATSNSGDSNVSSTSVSLIKDVLRPWLSHRSNKTSEACSKMLQSEECLSAFFKCMGSSCTFYTDDENIFKSHLLLHRKFQMDDWLNTLRCPYCVLEPSASCSPDDYILHLHEVHGFDRYQCGLCFYRSYNEYPIFKQHHQAHHQDQKLCIIEVRSPRIRLAAAELNIIKSKNIPEFVPQLKCYRK